MSEKTELVTLEILYQGLRLSGSGLLFIVVSPISNPLLTSSFSITKEKDWKPWSHITPGSVVIARVRLGEAENIDSLVMRADWVREWPDKVSRLRWSADYAYEELIAELTSAFLCAQHGVDGDLQHPEYIASWIRKLNDDKKYIFSASSAASKAVEFMNGSAEAEEEEAA